MNKVTRNEKHFIVTKITFDENQKVIDCIVEAVTNKKSI
jgi:hypothetical protein